MPLTNEQSRQVIDLGHAFSGLRLAKRELRLGYRYAMRWRQISGKTYLYCGQQSRGVKSPESEGEYQTYTAHRDALLQRIASLKARLDEIAPVNRALRLGRVPELPARLLRALDDEGVFAGGVMVIGTHALFAYEIAAGEFFQSDLLATTDLDLCWDAQERLVLLGDHGDPASILSILKRVDRSFGSVAMYGVSAANDQNFIVDLMSPSSEMLESATGVEGDIAAVPVPKIAALLSEPPFSAMAVGTDGLPVQIIAPQPVLFVAHKRVIAGVSSGRPVIQRRRDAAQADAVERVITELTAAKGLYSESA